MSLHTAWYVRGSATEAAYSSYAVYSAVRGRALEGGGDQEHTEAVAMGGGRENDTKCDSSCAPG